MDRFAKEGALAQVRLGRLLRSPSPRLDGLAEALAGLSGIETTSGAASWSVIDDEDPRMAVVSQGGLFGYADLEQGRLLLPPVYQDAGPFREGLAVVRLGDRFGLIDRDGVWRIDCGRYDYVGPLSGGRALVRRDGLYGFIDRHGREAIAVRYPFACSFTRAGRSFVSATSTAISIPRDVRRSRPFSTGHIASLEEKRVSTVAARLFLLTNRMNVGLNLIKVANFIPLFSGWADSWFGFFGNACRDACRYTILRY